MALKIRLLNWALKKLFPVFNLENVLTVDKAGRLYLNKKLVDGKKLANLKEQVRLVKNSELWSIMSETLLYQAQQTMFNESKTLQDLMNGKMICYTVDVQSKILEKIDKAK